MFLLPGNAIRLPADRDVHQSHAMRPEYGGDGQRSMRSARTSLLLAARIDLRDYVVYLQIASDIHPVLAYFPLK